MDKLNEFLTRNNVERNSLNEKLYNYFILFVFEELVVLLKDQEYRKVFKHTLRNISDINGYIEGEIKSKVGINLSKEEVNYIVNLVQAHLRKKDKRGLVTDKMKERLLENQGYKCNFCIEDISLANSHYDHDIPWSLVGDELDDNYQMLCEDCNLSKSNNIFYEVKKFLYYSVR